MELYYEQNVVNNNIEARAKRTKTLVIAKSIFYALALFILISSALLITMFWIFLIASIPFLVTGIIIGHLNKRNNTEYDYVLDDEYLKISEIYFRDRRKLKHSIRLRLIENIGVFGSEGYNKAEHLAQKRLLALVNYDDEKGIIYILYNTDKGKQMIFIEPDRGFMIALKRVVSAIHVFDDSIKDFENYLREKEELLMAESLEGGDYYDEDEEEEEDCAGESSDDTSEDEKNVDDDTPAGQESEDGE